MKSIITNIRKLNPITAILFTVVNCFFLLMFSHILIRVTVFAICAIMLFKWGKNPFADIDPIPFSAGVMQIWYGYPVSLQYIAWAIPAGDVVSGRLNQYSLVNLISLAIAITFVQFVGLPAFWHLFAVILIFNANRLAINLATGSGMNAFIAPATNAVIYIILASLLSPAISAAAQIVLLI